MIPNLSLSEFRTEISARIRETLDKHPGWNRPIEALTEGETNWRAQAMFLDLRAIVPFVEDESQVPIECQHDPDAWRVANRLVRAEWYAECAIHFGLVMPAPLKRKPKQLTLF